MSKNTLLKKTFKLSLEFDSYLVRNAHPLAKIPNKAYLVFTERGDDELSSSNRELARKGRGSRAKFIEVRKEGRRWTIHSLAPAAV